MKVKNWLRRLFCKHEWFSFGWYEANHPFIRYPIHCYCCRKCGKHIEVDGRNDKTKSVN